jgi:phosphoserine phosphatase
MKQTKPVTCRLFVMRHGQSIYNLQDIVSGHVNPDLTEEGRAQARAAKTRLSHVHFNEVYSSDLDRAIETAAIIFGAPVPKGHQWPELRERAFGVLDGMHNDHARKAFQECTEICNLDDEKMWTHAHIKGAESNHEVAERFIRALTKVAQANLGKTVLVGAHGGTVRTMLIALKHGTTADFPSGSIKNASFVELLYDGSKLMVVDARDAVDPVL